MTGMRIWWAGPCSGFHPLEPETFFVSLSRYVAQVAIAMEVAIAEFKSDKGCVGGTSAVSHTGGTIRILLQTI